MELQMFGNRYNALKLIKDFAENCGDYNQVLKGGLALNYLYDSLQPSARQTIDIDYHFTEESIWNKFKENACTVATENSKLGITYTPKRVKVNPNGERLYIEGIDKEGIIHKLRIDMNYGSYCKVVKKLNLNIFAPEMILADKIDVLCSSDIRRRAKDLYDIYLIASHESFDLQNLIEEIKIKLNSRGHSFGKLRLLNYYFLYELQQAYKKLRLLSMPKFDELCEKVLTFVLPILDLKATQEATWNPKTFSWTNHLFESSRLQTDITGIFYAETASGHLGLSSFPPYPILLQNPLIELDMGLVKFINKDFNVYYIEQVNEDLFITTKERTIVDLVDGEYRIFAESLEEYLDEDGSLEKLYEVARHYNKEFELKELIKDVEEYSDRIY